MYHFSIIHVHFFQNQAGEPSSEPSTQNEVQPSTSQQSITQNELNKENIPPLIEDFEVTID